MANGKLEYWQWKNYLNSSALKQLNKFINKSILKDEPIDCAATENGNTKKFLKTKLIPWINIKDYLPYFWDKIRNVNLNSFGYDIIEPTALDQVHYNIYSSKSKDRYDWHVDSASIDDPLVDIKFTVLINISDK